MVGYVYINRVAYALIQAPDGVVHYVHTGNYMGQNMGKIVSITDTEVKLEEWVQDGSGVGAERITTMQLAE
jgi:type IV pilus assembly protein PilP